MEARKRPINWWGKITGEVSKLRNFVVSVTGGGTNYKLDSTRPNPQTAREIYDNTNDKYKLGAGFCRRIVNAKLGFMGIPKFISKDPNDEAQQILDSCFEENESRLGRAFKKTLIEGDCIIWVTREEIESKLYPELTTRLVFNIIPIDSLVQEKRDPLTNAVKEYIFRFDYEWYDDSNTKRKTTIEQRISATRRVITTEGDIIEGLAVDEENPWGFIPIVHFKNEDDGTKEFGQSEFEPLEPYIKCYHDVMLHAIEGSQMHSTPRLKLKLKDIANFLRFNFGITDPEQFVKNGSTVSLDGHEVLFFAEGEDAQYAEIQSGTGSAEPLLKLLFYCIVDISEVPEFVFGVHTPSSLSSVREQMPVVERMIQRKRKDFTEPAQRLARIVLAMTTQSETLKFDTYATTLEWKEVDPRNEKEVAETLELIARALGTAIDKEMISVAAAAEFLRKYIPTMLPYQPEDGNDTGDSERNRIITDKLIRGRLEDGDYTIQSTQNINDWIDKLVNKKAS